jgi:hypothetical protein
MPLIAVPGSASANSYLSVAEADALAAALGLGRAATKWTAAASGLKEKALIRATSEIDAFIATAGSPWSSAQSLLFPRLVDFAVVLGEATPFIIENVRKATYEQAVHLLLNADLIDDANTRRARGLIQFSDDDGSGSVVSVRPEFGLMSSQALAYLRPLRGLGRASLTSVPIASSYSR